MTVPFGQNAGDLLSDQVNLTYQIFNLRMLLERSLSDRLLDGSARRQAVVGFNISLDPPAYAKDSAAVVEITVESPKSGVGSVSLVAMMPQEKTYNAVALDTKSNAFSGSAVSSYVNVGVAGRRSSRTMYLYRDNDTIAYEDMMRAEADSELQFGWVFRPVLGRRSVSPGMRQMFAVLALPAQDEAECAGKGQAEKECVLAAASSMTVKVRTYWKKYKRDTLTTYSRSQVVGWPGFRNLFGTPAVLSDPYMNFATYSGVAVESPAVTDGALKPKIQSVSWTYTGAKSILVSLKGANFFPGTSVILGGRTYKESAGNLLIKSDSIMDIATDLDGLVRADGVVVGRYGAAEPIVVDSSSSTPSTSLTGDISVGPALGGIREITIPLRPACATLPKSEKTGSLRLPLILLNDASFSDRATISCDTGTAELKLSVADELITSKAPRLQVIYPFGSRSDRISVIDPNIAFQLDRIGGDSNTYILRAKANPDFTSGCKKLLVGPGREVTIPAKDCAATDHVRYLTSNSVLITGLKAADGALFSDKFLLLNGPAPYEVAVPPAKKDPAKPAFDGGQTPSIGQNDARWITVTGTELDGVFAAKINALAIDLRLTAAKKPADKDKLQLYIPRSISEKSGDLDITFYDTSNKVIDTVPLRIVCMSCKTK